MNEFTILLEDLEISMFLGLHDFEKERPQRVLISARIEVNSNGPEDYFDYDRVTDFIRGFAGSAIETQEELAMRIHAFIMDLGAQSAQVHTRKPDIYKDCKSIGILFKG